MPFYEYQCSACGSHHEELQKVSARPLRKCPACGRTALKRLVSAPVFRLSGGGWYETDFKADKESQRNLAGEKEPPADKPKEEKAADKTAEKAPAADAAVKPADTRPKPVAAKAAPRRRRAIRRPRR